MSTANTQKQSSNIEAVPASDFWLSIARQRLAEYHAQMTSPTIPRSSKRFAELSRAMRTEASVLEHISKLFVVQWHADAPGIDSLPREILDYIFSLVAELDRPCPPYNCHFHDANGRDRCRLGNRRREDGHENGYPVMGSGGCLGWLRLGHVCQSWRNGLLGSPALWASDVGLLPRGLDSMLERARDMPLTIRIYMSTCRPESAAVLDAMAASPTSSIVLRARELDIIDVRQDDMHDMDGLDAFFNECTFPSVERAAIRGEDDGYIREISQSFFEPSRRSPTLRSIAPRR